MEAELRLRGNEVEAVGELVEGDVGQMHLGVEEGLDQRDRLRRENERPPAVDLIRIEADLLGEEDGLEQLVDLSGGCGELLTRLCSRLVASKDSEAADQRRDQGQDRRDTPLRLLFDLVANRDEKIVGGLGRVRQALGRIPDRG